MTYDWDAHKDEIYRLYVSEGKSLEATIDVMKASHGFGASKRGYQLAFRRWNFPTKQRLAHRNEALVSRVKELWERHLPSSKMLAILKVEGFELSSGDLLRIRQAHRWLLRATNGYDKGGVAENGSLVRDDAVIFEAVPAPPSDNRHGDGLSFALPVGGSDPPEKRGRKARRGVDANGAMRRFPSEMTIGMARAILRLDNTAYVDLLSAFQRICRREGIAKKTAAGPARWEELKSELVDELPFLHWVRGNAKESKGDSAEARLALDVLCTHVTRRYRISYMTVGVTGAKKILRLDPQKFREVRRAFSHVLQTHQLERRSDANPQLWEQLKRRWVANSAILRASLNDRSNGESAESKGRALEVLARDALKRLRDGRNRKRPGSKRSGSTPLQTTPQEHDESELHQGDGTADSALEVALSSAHGLEAVFGSSPRTVATSHRSATLTPAQGAWNQWTDTLRPRAYRHEVPGPLAPGSRPVSNSMIARARPNTAAMRQNLASTSQPPPLPYLQQQHNTQNHQSAVAKETFAAYFRLHPSTNLGVPSTMWITTIGSRGVQELREVAAQNFPGATCVRVEGVVKDGRGSEVPLLIQTDEELATYLDYPQSGTPTFIVQLAWRA